MKYDKIEIDLNEIIKDKVYRALVEKNWTEIEHFRQAMERKIDETSEKIAQKITRQVMQEVKLFHSNKKGDK